MKLLPTAPDDIRGRFGPSAPILGVARNSEARGRHGRQQVAQNAVMLLRSLEARGIVDVLDQAPSEADFIRLLEHSADIVTVGSDRWTYATWTSQDKSLIILLCQGSGRKVDGDGIQPLMARVKEMILTLKPVAVWTFELDRLGRDELGLAQIVRAIDANSADGYECWLGSADRGLIPRYEGWDVGLYFEGRQSRTQAESLTRRTQATMLAKTPSRMTGGRCVFPIPTVPPPGLSRARLRDGRGGKGDAVIFLDTPPLRPTADELFEPLPSAVDDAGDTACQVSNVRWALAQIASGRSTLEIASVLFARGYSTVQFHRIHGLEATYRSIHGVANRKVAYGICHQIASSIDFYESGILTVRVAGETLQISNCLPEGGWVTPETAAGVRRWVGQRGLVSASRSRTSLGGLKVTLDGQPRRLYLVSPSCLCTGEAQDDDG